MRKTCSLTVFALVLAAAVLIALPARTYDPNLDHDNNQWIDENDLLYFMQHWHTGTGPVETETPSVSTATPTPTPTATEAAAETPTFTPTSTPTQTQSSGNNILSMPTLIPVEMTDTGLGSYSGEVSVPVKLSNVAGLTQADILFTIPLADDPDYIINTSGISLTGLVTENWTVEDINDGAQGFGWRISGPALVGTGNEETILSVTATVMTTSDPLPEDRVVEVDFYQTDLTGAGPWDEVAGSLLINPSGSTLPTVTPTATSPAGETPTPTPTGDGGDAAKLQVIACKTEEFAGNIVEVWVDQLNADNQIVNPGVQDGAPSRDVTASLTGQAVFAETEDTSWTQPLNFATGIMYSVKGTAVGQVTVNASSAGVDDAAPLTIDFVEGGAISGTIRVPESVGGNLQPAPFPGVEISVYEAATREFVLSTMVGLEEDGKYQTPFMAAGLYDVSVDPIYYNHSRMAEDEMLGAECIRGVQVVGGQTTENTNADLAFLTGGARVFGDITLADGGDPLEQGGVTLIPQNEDACAQQSFFTAISIDEQSGAASYEFLNVPQGAYSILASGIRNEESLTHPLLTDLDVPASGQLQQDLELAAGESVDITQDAPINYQRVASPPSFSWTLSEEPGASLVYRLTVGDRCGNTLWENAEVEASPAVYGGTQALIPNDIYNWSISGSSEDGSVMATVPFQWDMDPEFLVE
jgi:hypothetical protein